MRRCDVSGRACRCGRAPFHPPRRKPPLVDRVTVAGSPATHRRHESLGGRPSTRDIFTIFGHRRHHPRALAGHLAAAPDGVAGRVLSSIPIFLFGFIVFFGLPKPFFYRSASSLAAALTAYNGHGSLCSPTRSPLRARRVFGVVSAVAQTGRSSAPLATAIWNLDRTWVGGCSSHRPRRSPPVWYCYCSRGCQASGFSSSTCAGSS